MVAPRWVALGSSGGLVPRLRLAGSATGVKTCAATTALPPPQPTSYAGVPKPGPPCLSASEGGMCVNLEFFQIYVFIFSLYS